MDEILPFFHAASTTGFVLFGLGDYIQNCGASRVVRGAPRGVFGEIRLLGEGLFGEGGHVFGGEAVFLEQELIGRALAEAYSCTTSG